MVQLRSCYFCGTTGALSEYDALPPALLETEAQTPRVILCNRCHTKLSNVLAPLVGRAERDVVGVGAETDAETDQPSTGASRSTSEATPTDEPTSDVSEADARSSQPEVTFAGSSPPTSADEADHVLADTEPNANPSGTGDAAGAETEADSPDDEHDGVDTAVDEEGDDEAVDQGRTDVATIDTEDEQESAAETEPAPPQETSLSPDLDRVYYKLLRFLRNREFPVPRSEAEAIAQSAYDLTATEASQVIQRTIDQDVLEERDGDLHRR